MTEYFLSTSLVCAACNCLSMYECTTRTFGLLVVRVVWFPLVQYEMILHIYVCIYYISIYTKYLTGAWYEVPFISTAVLLHSVGITCCATFWEETNSLGCPSVCAALEDLQKQCFTTEYIYAIDYCSTQAATAACTAVVVVVITQQYVLHPRAGFGLHSSSSSSTLVFRTNIS